MTSHRNTAARLAKLQVAIGLLVLSGCNPKTTEGTYLILDLENSENIQQYWVHNPYNQTIEECKATAEKAIAEIIAKQAIPKDSRVKRWRCSLLPPERGG